MDLKKFRTDNNLSQTEFAKIIGVPRTTYQMWEYDLRSPTNSNMILLEKAIKKIEAEKQDINKVIKELSIIKSYEKAVESYKKIQEYYNKYKPLTDDFEEEDHHKKSRLKYAILLLVLIIIFTVLF